MRRASDRWTGFGITSRNSGLAANPVAFFIVCAYGVLWFLFERETFNWHAIATLATWMMTLFIQRSEHRDTQAIHAKLDELLRSDPNAETELARLDDEEPELFEEVRQQRAKAPPRPLCKAGRGEEELPPPGTAFSHPLAFTLIQSVLLPD